MQLAVRLHGAINQLSSRDRLCTASLGRVVLGPEKVGSWPAAIERQHCDECCIEQAIASFAAGAVQLHVYLDRELAADGGSHPSDAAPSLHGCRTVPFLRIWPG